MPYAFESFAKHLVSKGVRDAYARSFLGAIEQHGSTRVLNHIREDGEILVVVPTIKPIKINFVQLKVRIRQPSCVLLCHPLLPPLPPLPQLLLTPPPMIATAPESSSF